jgi:UDP-N-acetylenolpyruvoylglucosamine reductase
MKKKKIRKYFFLGEGSNIIFKNIFFDGVIIKISNNFLK